HFTVFEMLGNFSFGDYFKADAIRWAWQLSTQGFGFAPERIWVTVYEDDDEAEQLWLSETEVPRQRIQRVGIPEGETRRDASDNYWSMGGAGPCGPCSELYYDRGPEHGPPGGPAVDENRYLEFWNLVFMQFEQDEHGVILGELPQQNVDTGMGLERMAMLLQGVPNAYETDMLRPLVDRAAELTGVAYGETEEADVSLRVIAEHARATAFLVGDGVLPSNEARGYVLRRLWAPWPRPSSTPSATPGRSCAPSASWSPGWSSPRRPSSPARCAPGWRCSSRPSTRPRVTTARPPTTRRRPPRVERAPGTPPRPCSCRGPRRSPSTTPMASPST
ncbi:MAG: hypothetical protein BRC31_00255, partial [Actinobacteria bacterium QS_5_72_10]